MNSVWPQTRRGLGLSMSQIIRVPRSAHGHGNAQSKNTASGTDTILSATANKLRPCSDRANGRLWKSNGKGHKSSAGSPRLPGTVRASQNRDFFIAVCRPSTEPLLQDKPYSLAAKISESTKRSWINQKCPGICCLMSAVAWRHARDSETRL
jgi:hypothetical protein